jgi:tetratricopeptide (TPR) repeat protein
MKNTSDSLSNFNPLDVRRSNLRALCLKLVCFFAAALLFASGLASASTEDDPGARFDQANRHYEQGQFAEAIAAYQDLLALHPQSVSLHYNLANAFLQTDQQGHAVVHYRLARALAPRDRDVRANLRFARSQIGGGNQGLGWLADSWISLNELTLLATGCWWAFFGCAALVQFRSPHSRPLRRAAPWLGSIGVILLLWAGAVWSVQERHPAAVLVAREAPVRFGPLEESRTAFPLRDGAELKVLDQKDGWLRIRDAVGRQGWISGDHLRLVRFSPAANSPSFP